MDREKILLYSEKKENLGKPEHFLGAGEVKEPGCGDCLEIFFNFCISLYFLYFSCFSFFFIKKELIY